jgi:predicted porin
MMKINRKVMAFAVGGALAAPGAYAQVTSKAGSDWEFYGKFYPELTHASGTGATAPGTTGLSSLVGTLGGNAIVSRWEMQPSNTYLGFRGSKDIGQGSKAIWQLEQAVSVDQGDGKPLGNRDTFVGVSSGYGTIRLGNMDTPFKKAGDVLGFLGVSSGNFVSTSNMLRKTGFGASSSSSFHLRRANAVDLASPKILGGLSTAAQYSIGNPDETTITNSPKRNPHVASWTVKWEQGPLYAAFMQEAHFDLFGGSKNAPAAASNAADAGVRSKDIANQVAVVYKIGPHSFEADYIKKSYKENAEGSVAANPTGRFVNYKNNTWMLVVDSRWNSKWRTAAHYIRSGAGSCELFNATCTTNGLEGTQISVGAAYYLDPAMYIFGLASKVTNDQAARFNNSTQGPTAPNPGEDIKQGSIGLAYIF